MADARRNTRRGALSTTLLLTGPEAGVPLDPGVVPLLTLADSGEFQNRAVLSVEAEATVLPSGEKLTVVTGPVCPVRMRKVSPLELLQMRTVLSAEAEASISP